MRDDEMIAMQREIAALNATVVQISATQDKVADSLVKITELVTKQDQSQKDIDYLYSENRDIKQQISDIKKYSASVDAHIQYLKEARGWIINAGIAVIFLAVAAITTTVHISIK